MKYIGLKIFILLALFFNSYFGIASLHAEEKQRAKKIEINKSLKSKLNDNTAVIAKEDNNDALFDLPPYNKNAVRLIGEPEKYTIGEEDTLLDIARYFKLGFIELIAANPNMDPWTPELGAEVIIPKQKMLPRVKQKDIVVNLAQMRLYIFPKNKTGKESKGKILSFPIGIGRAGLRTPKGITRVVRKTKDPIWHPTKRMREEDPSLPIAVHAGAANPLGTRALYLGWPTFLIHGSNMPWAIGRRVSSGCMRMYPEDILDVYKDVDVKTSVTVVDQPILVGWNKNKLYLEANPSKSQGYALETGGVFKPEKMNEKMKSLIINTAGKNKDLIDWVLVKKIIKERRGYPIVIANKNNNIVITL